MDKVKAVLRNLEEHDYPLAMSSEDELLNCFDFVESEGKSWSENFDNAEKAAEKTGGRVYTQLDAGGTEVVYLKGKHYVDRIGVCVLVRERK